MKIESMFISKLCHDIRDAMIIPKTCYAMLIALHSHQKTGHDNNGCLGIPEQCIVGYCDMLPVDTLPAVH